MLYLTFPLAALIELFAPVALAARLARKSGWLLVGVGALTFIGSQVIHIPLNIGLAQIGLLTNDPALMLRTAVTLGLSAGLCEETARAAGYWLLGRRARTWATALTLGAGHGGIESIAVGALVLLTFVNMNAVRSLDLSTVYSGAQLELAHEQVAEYWGQPWHMPLAGAVERLVAIVMHLSLSMLVLQAFIRRNALYYAGAVAWHAAVNALAVILLLSNWSAWAIEGVLALSVPLSLGIIIAFRYRQDAEPVPACASAEPMQPITFTPRGQTDALREQIEQSRFDA